VLVRVTWGVYLAFLNSVDLLQLVEEAVDGCWVGHRARTVITGDSGIGSLYSPPKDNVGSPSISKAKLVETIVDIGYRSEVRNRVAYISLASPDRTLGVVAEM